MCLLGRAGGAADALSVSCMLMGWLSTGHPSIAPSVTLYLAQLGHG